MIRCTHCGWLIECREGAWAHSDGRYFCWDTKDYRDPDYATPNEVAGTTLSRFAFFGATPQGNTVRLEVQDAEVGEKATYTLTIEATK